MNIPKPKKPTIKQKASLKDIFHRWKHGELHMGRSGHVVPYPNGHKQAIAIALSVSGLSKLAQKRKAMGKCK